MNGKWLVLSLAVLGSAAWAQVGELYNADVIANDRISDPAKAVSTAEGQWLAFSMPVLEGTHSPCCWTSRRGIAKEFGCSLDSRHTSFGTRSDSPLTDAVIVYSKINDGKAHSLRVFGEQCPLDGNDAQVTWLGAVDQEKALDYLEDVARKNRHDSALYALALHRDDDAARRLYSLARDSDAKHGSEAIFWLGEARGEQGFKFLQRLLGELPRGERRREINFALSQNDSPEAAELLLQIARSDPDSEQRGEALFWLAQAYPQQAEGWLQEVIATERDADLLEKAVFAVSQLPGKRGSQMLLDIATDKQAPHSARRQALFWLAQSDDDEAVATLADLLTR